MSVKIIPPSLTSFCRQVEKLSIGNKLDGLTIPEPKVGDYQIIVVVDSPYIIKIVSLTPFDDRVELSARFSSVNFFTPFSNDLILKGIYDKKSIIEWECITPVRETVYAQHYNMTPIDYREIVRAYSFISGEVPALNHSVNIALFHAYHRHLLNIEAPLYSTIRSSLTPLQHYNPITIFKLYHQRGYFLRCLSRCKDMGETLEDLKKAVGLQYVLLDKIAHAYMEIATVENFSPIRCRLAHIEFYLLVLSDFIDSDGGMRLFDYKPFIYIFNDTVGLLKMLIEQLRIS